MAESQCGSQSSRIGLWLQGAFINTTASIIPAAILDLLSRLDADAAAIPLGPSAIKAFEQEFFRELEATVPHLRAFGLSLTGNADLTDDLLQDTLMKAWAARTRFEAGTSMRAWTFTILRNQFLSQMRRAKFKGEWSEIIADRLLVTRAAQGSALDLSDLYRALDHVPRTQREAMLLVGAGGLNYEDAATIAECAVGTIKSRVSRGRAALKVVLESKIMAPRIADTEDDSAFDGIMAEVGALTHAHSVG